MMLQSKFEKKNGNGKKPQRKQFLFVHFTGEQQDGQQIYFSISQDGRHFKDLNQGFPILRSTVGEKGVRDPFMVRDETRGIFYLIATDLHIKSGKDWNAAQNEGSLNIVVWESTDLIYWSEPRLLPVDLTEAGNVWAPEVIYDERQKAFFVFWASRIDGKHKMYGAYTTDFQELSKPFMWMERINDVIDSTIIRHGETFYRFTKDETTSQIILEQSNQLINGYEIISAPVLSDLVGVEGPEIYQVASDKWFLIVDRFADNQGYMIIETTDLASGDFRVLSDSEYDFDENMKRHGGILPITSEEYSRLSQYFDQQNPVISGLFADPDLVRFGDYYYIYPTTDGVKNWGAKCFSVFKSKDLQNFEDAGVIVDFTTGQVPWAVSNAWAPCIAEKQGRYYYYFCGKDSDGQSCIGVAQSETPTGPFEANIEPLLVPDLIKHAGLDISQIIDPSIYQEDGDSYLLFGNGHTGGIVQLTADMRHIKVDTMHSLVDLVDFREALSVFKKDGLYHFTWSCDDTGSEDYHINYGISDSLYGPVIYQYPILQKYPEKQILGTGHHSILREPKMDTYFIAYHRFSTPLEKYPDNSKGYNREICISLVDFDDAGLIRPIIV